MDRPLVSYYGDDFTGSTDVMEALASNGIATVLFLDVPHARNAGALQGLPRNRHCRDKPQRDARLDATAPVACLRMAEVA